MADEQAGNVILLVEDEPLILRSTATLLEDGGYQVLEAGNYAEAIERMEARPDICSLVTDISFGDGPDGMALANAVAERWPHVRIIIVSGRVRARSDQCPEGAVFFTKPYAPGALLTLVSGACD